MSDRQAFDAAVTAYTAGDVTRARHLFTAITQTSPTMSDAWLGRIACGDHELATLAGAHSHSRMLGKETNRWQRGALLRGEVITPRYLKIGVFNRSGIAMAYASMLIKAARFDEAASVLDDPVITTDTGAAQWRQLLYADLYHMTQRFTDVAAITAVNPPPAATNIQPILTAAVDTLAAWAAAHMGRTEAATALADTVIANLDPAANPYILADAWTIKGWCRRAAGDTAGADAAFLTAAVDGVLTMAASDALAHPNYQLALTTPERIATRTNKWDPDTETTPAAQAAQQRDTARRDALTRATRLLDSLIGLDKQKEEIQVWRTEIQLEQLLGGAGGKENHMVLAGPPGTAKTTFARIASEILFGLGLTERPDITEVSEEDLVVGYVSQTPQRMKEVCEDALGGVLFIDEAYRLTSRPEGHSFGKQAVETLLKYMEDYSGKLVVVAAGYPQEMQQFLDANPGLRSRFTYTLTFGSYTPAEIVAIGQSIAAAENITISGQAWPLLRAEATRLRDTPAAAGTALDVAGNARFARKVVRGCKRERARRLRTLTPDALAALTTTDPDALTVNPDDMGRAITEAAAGI